MVRFQRRLLKRVAFDLFLLLDRLGLHVLPKHYYSPVPDYAWLLAHKDLWTGRANLTGVHWDLAAQLAWLREICLPYYHEVQGLHVYGEITERKVGPGFGPIESQVLHCFIRANRPRKIVEIGSGVSTYCALYASRLNEKEGSPPIEILCVEPYPSEDLRNEKRVKLIEAPCQAVQFADMGPLHDGDLFFIDSTHAVKVGSDVNHIYLNLLPQLPPRITIHIHDIYLPYLYPRHALTNFLRAWQETALVYALLINNARLEVLSCLSALHYDCGERLKRLLSDYRPVASYQGTAVDDEDRGQHFPASLWLGTC
jgi:hypothetical protein